MRKLLSFLCCCMMMAAMTVPALAVDNYRFETVNADEFYVVNPPHSSEYGATIIVPELDIGYGLTPEKPRNAPGGRQLKMENGELIMAASDGGISYPESHYTLSTVNSTLNPDGSIGTLSIPAIGLTVTAYDGEVTAAMKSGVGHIDSTSAWSSNVGLVGHNRGVNNHFGKLKKLKLGDEITYTTALGTRTYIVTAVEKIASTDWSWLQYTTDNRITLITCVEDQPQYRLAVQAVEKSSASH